MLTKLEMRAADELFERLKGMLFECGSIPPLLATFKGEEIDVYPIPEELELGMSVGTELALKLGLSRDADIAMFIAESWMVQVDKKPESNLLNLSPSELRKKAEEVIGVPPSKHPDKFESLTMLVIEVKTSKTHMKIGKILEDGQGGKYITSDEWVSEDKLQVLPPENQTLNA